MTATSDPYQAAQDSAARLADLTGQPRHDVAVVLGSGWAPAADALGDTDAEVPLDALGGFPPPTVGGHSPAVRSVRAGPVRALVFLGRVHLYEGHDPATVVHGVRTAVAAGCQVVVLTNAAGGIREGYQVGQPVLIRDHLNLTGRSPLGGPPPPDGYPPRFTDLTDLYSARLRALAAEADEGLAEGVYAALPGPHYETPAEIRMLRTAGADLVGMSTVLEAIAARHLGAEVLAISLVSNLAAGLAPHGLDHLEVVAAGKAAAGRMGSLLAGLLPVLVPGR
jgi:purine-nucleoside phosphorylase